MSRRPRFTIFLLLLVKKSREEGGDVWLMSENPVDVVGARGCGGASRVGGSRLKGVSVGGLTG